MKILVTDGNTLPGLAITRSLGKAGHEVIVGHHKPESLASKSKYAKGSCVFPDPGAQPRQFIEFLLDYVEYKNIDCIFPVTDITTLPITKYKSDFEKYCQIPFADYEVVDNTANKAHVLQLAKQLGIDTPESIIVNSYDELDLKQIQFDFPVVIKPARSRILQQNRWISTTVTYAYDEEDLKQQLKSYEQCVFPILLQERIIGPGLGIFMCMHEGNPVAAFSHRRLREKPPSGGVSVLRESIPLDPVPTEFSEKLLRELGWKGVAMVEFKFDNRDQRPKLMEINGRFWGSLQLAIDAGVDFPALLAETVTNNKLEPITSYKIGVQTRWLWGDFDALIIRLLKSEKALQLPPGSDSKLRYLLNFMKFWGKNKHNDVLWFSDIKPWLYETLQRVRGIYKFVTR